MRFFTLLILVLMLVVAFPAAAQEAAQEGGAAALIAQLGGQPCAEDSAFTCVTLSVPLNHFDASSAETTSVVFGLLPAAGERFGAFVTATGGPGYSGLAAADPYTAYFDPALTEHFDIVFFDQRGIGQSGGLRCDNAELAWNQADLRSETPEEEAALVAAAQRFATDCVAEMGNRALLPYLGTTQAVEDLEVFRRALGDEQFWLYGESYGTQFAQTYAARYPQHLAGLILDGVVDLTLEAQDFYAQQAQAFSSALTSTLRSCNADAACGGDFGRATVLAYDTIRRQLAQRPANVSFPLADGTRAERSLTLANLEYVAVNAVYDEASRTQFLRTLAAGLRGDFVPLLRLAYVYLNLDPQTLAIMPDPDFSAAMYFGVECSDYNFFEGTPQERAQAFLRAGDAVEASVQRLASIFYTDLPCAFWPVQGEATRPAPLLAEGVATFVLNATADPATPVQQGFDVFGRLADAYQITVLGGPHVIFGRGNECPDVAVTAWMVSGALPVGRDLTCEGRIIDPYLPLPARTLSSIEEGARALDVELSLLPEYVGWDLASLLSVGCTYGGTAEFVPTETGELWTLNACAMTPNWAATGRGVLDYEAEQLTLTLEVRIPQRDAAQMTYTRAGLFVSDGGETSVTFR
ncbi:MAG: alpha/beta fold hydrolase [Chloroflexi bacterium]|nr:alpha/beta fold hydrolase [Chloroflexota bacterium]